MLYNSALSLRALISISKYTYSCRREKKGKDWEQIKYIDSEKKRGN